MGLAVDVVGDAHPTMGLAVDVVGVVDVADVMDLRELPNAGNGAARA
jgi:hypothetical protein